MKISEEIIKMAGSLGLTRDEMPQIDADRMDAFKEYLRNNHEFESHEVEAGSLTPVQDELDTDKADKIWSDGNAFTNPIIISLDKYVLDGHHRWLAVYRNEPTAKMNCIMIGSNVKDALQIMHDFDGVKKRDIEDNMVEKLSKQIIKNFKEEFKEENHQTDVNEVDLLNDHLEELGYENIQVEEISYDESEGTCSVIFTDDSDNDLLAVFFIDEEHGPVVTVLEDAEDLYNDDIDVIVLGDSVPVKDGMIDFSADLNWLDEETLEEILNFDQMEERQIAVIRGGKRVKKTIKRKIRKKRLTAKKKMGIRKAVRKRKLKKNVSARKRKRSLVLRKRAGLKNRPKNTRLSA